MSKKHTYKKQNKQVVDFYRRNAQMCIQEINKIHNACIAANLIRGK